MPTRRLQSHSRHYRLRLPASRLRYVLRPFKFGCANIICSRPSHKLIQERFIMKSRINTRHDTLNSQLPAEIVAYIFDLVVKSSGHIKMINKSWVRPPVVLGAVCKGWRDITLYTPQLWSSITIDVRDWTSPFALNPVEKWLRRSVAVPLSLSLHVGTSWGPIPHSAAKPMINLLRSHAGRWKYIKFSGAWKLWHNLFNKLDNVVPIGVILHTQFIEAGEDVERDPISLCHSIYPNEFISDAFPLAKMDVRWSNLTLLNARSMHVDEVLHILSEANGLLDCNIYKVLGYSSKYPLPVNPIVHHRLKRFGISSDSSLSGSNIVLEYLVSPSLKIFEYRWGKEDNSR